MDELTLQRSLHERPPGDPHYRLRLSAEPGPVAAATKTTSSATARTRPLLIAARLVVAGAIVALFGGFLLAGLLTQPSERVAAPASSPTATWTPPPELTMEEIAPGVTQATLAGVGSFEAASAPHDFAFDAHGDMWLLSPAGLQRVGDDTAHPSPGPMPYDPDLSLAPDGALWTLANDTVASFRDGAWTEAPPFPGDTEDPPGALEVLPDGTVWARTTTTLARLDGDAWTAYRITDDEGPVPDAGYVFPGDLAWTPDGSLWVTTNGARKRKRGGLLRFDGEVFHQVEPPVPVEGWIGPLVSGQDGELWAYLDADPPRLARFDGTDWESSGRVPRIQRTGFCFGRMVASPDGRLWAIATDKPCAGDVLGAYDGAAWTGVGALPESWLTESAKLHMGPDGNLWVEPVHGLFLIATPEALASIEPADQSVEEGESPEQATTPDLLPGVDLTTEEVEPGVYRVDGDGIRSLSRPMGSSRVDDDIHRGMEGSIVAGLDGSVWWFGQDGFFRLGEPGVHEWPDERQDTFFYGNGISPNSLKIDLEVGPHGIVWLSRHGWGGVEGDDLTTVYEDEISSFDGESWSVHLQPDGEVVGVEVLQDGDVWGAWVSSYAPRQQVTVARLGDAGWEPLPVVLGDGGDLSMAASGDGGMLWLLPGGGQRLQRYDGTGWEEQTTPDVGGEMAADVAPDGTLWVGLSRDCGPGTPGNTPDGGYCIGGYDTLARFDGTDWEVFDASDGVPPTGGHHMMFWGSLEAAPNGSVWFDPTVPQDEVVDTDCDGVANLDGSAVTRYLRGMCIYAMDVGPDGDVWLQAGQPGDDDPLPIHTYVITADAGVASE